MAEQNRFKDTLKSVGTTAREVYRSAKAALLSSTSAGEEDPIPKDWAKRALKAHEYATTIDVVAKCVSTWRALVLGDGVRLLTSEETNRQKLSDFARRINLNLSARDLFHTAIVRGEFLAYKSWDGNELKRIRSVNPVSVEPKYENGELVALSQYPMDSSGKVSTSGAKPLTDLENYFHFRLNTPEWMPRGNSMILPAFELIEILKAYRKADKAIAKRWTSPVRFVKLGGELGGKKFVIPTAADIDSAKNAMNNMDPNSGLVVPWHWDIKTYGTEGTVLDTTERIKLLCDQIAVAILLVPFLVTGSGPTFATARVNLKALRFQIMDFVSMIKSFLDWLFDAEVLRSIGVPEGTRVDYQFSGLDVDAEEWERNLFVELYKQNIVSKRTIQLLFNLDPDTEDRYVSQEPIVISRSWSAQDMIGMVGVDVFSKELARSKLGISEAEATQVAAAAADAALNRIYAFVNQKIAKDNEPKDNDEDASDTGAQEGSDG